MAFLPIERVRVDRVFSDGLPNPSESEFEGLVQDIQARGIVVDLIVTADGLLLDGHRRFAAAKQLGLKEVPVKTVECSGEGEWEKALMLALNLCRRHLGEVQRAVLGSSLLRLERCKARERQRDGQERGRRRRWNEALDLGSTHPEPESRVPDRATERVAKIVGISRQSLERVEAVKFHAPAILQRMLEGEISIASAYRQMRVHDLKVKSKEVPDHPGLLKDLEPVFGKYRTVYLDPPWHRRAPGKAAENLEASVDPLRKLPLRALANKEGCHYWLWCPWPLLRSGDMHTFLKAWDLTWVAELLWDRGAKGQGHWFHARTEVLMLAATGSLPLLRSDVPAVHALERERSGEKPEGFRKLIEDLSPGPRIELLAKEKRRGWDGWRGELLWM